MKNLKYFRAKAILLMFILVLVITVLSCRKPTTYYMPQDLKDYCMFPVGSWWVYEDSISGEKDSIVLMEQSVFIDGPVKSGFYWESIGQEFYNSYCDTITTSNMHVSNRDPLIYSYFFSKGFYFSTDYGISENVIYNYLDTIIINNTQFNEIKIFDEKRNSNNHTMTYWAKNIGVIKYVNPNFNWKLKYYHMNH